MSTKEKLVKTKSFNSGSEVKLPRQSSKSSLTKTGAGELIRQSSKSSLIKAGALELPRQSSKSNLTKAGAGGRRPSNAMMKLRGTVRTVQMISTLSKYGRRQSFFKY